MQKSIDVLQHITENLFHFELFNDSHFEFQNL